MRIEIELDEQEAAAFDTLVRSHTFGQLTAGSRTSVAKHLLMFHLGSPCPDCGITRQVSLEASYVVPGDPKDFDALRHHEAGTERKLDLPPPSENPEAPAGVWISAFQNRERLLRCANRECPSYRAIWVETL
jgi:hypothetical protein